MARGNGNRHERGRGTKQTVHFMFSHVHMYNFRFTILLFFCKQSEMPRRMCCDEVGKGRAQGSAHYAVV